MFVLLNIGWKRSVPWFTCLLNCLLKEYACSFKYRLEKVSPLVYLFSQLLGECTIWGKMQVFGMAYEGWSTHFGAHTYLKVFLAEVFTLEVPLEDGC